MSEHTRSEFNNRVKENKKVILKIARDLRELEKELTYQSVMSPVTVELAHKLTETRWALLGLVSDCES